MGKKQSKLQDACQKLFPNKRGKAFGEYLQMKSSLEATSPEELDFEYGRSVAAYENKKGAWGLLWGTVIVSLLVCVWSGFFKVVQAFLMYAQTDSAADPVEATAMGIAIVAPVAIIMTGFILLMLRDSMREARKLREKILLIETIKDKEK